MACFHGSGVQGSHFCPYEKGTLSPFHECRIFRGESVGYSLSLCFLYTFSTLVLFPYYSLCFHNHLALVSFLLNTYFQLFFPWFQELRKILQKYCRSTSLEKVWTKRLAADLDAHSDDDDKAHEASASGSSSSSVSAKVCRRPVTARRMTVPSESCCCCCCCCRCTAAGGPAAAGLARAAGSCRQLGRAAAGGNGAGGGIGTGPGPRAPDVGGGGTGPDPAAAKSELLRWPSPSASHSSCASSRKMPCTSSMSGLAHEQRTTAHTHHRTRTRTCTSATAHATSD